MDLEIGSLTKLLESRWVLSLATSDLDGRPYATPLFYAMVPPKALPAVGAPLLLFASHPQSSHGVHIGDRPCPVAASVQLETRIVGRIRGAQLRGSALPVRLCGDAISWALRSVYLQRHPVAAGLLSGDSEEELYLLVVNWAKMTDNRWGIGQHRSRVFDPDWSRLKIATSA